MKRVKMFTLAVAMFLSLEAAFAQENPATAQKKPQQYEVILSKENRTNGGYHDIHSAYIGAKNEAQRSFPYKEIGIRNLKEGAVKVNSDGSVTHYYTYTVVELPAIVTRKLISAVNKASLDIEENNSFALDKLVITDNETDKEKIKSQVIELLLGKGYKVVAKEKLEKLYQEQQDQVSGIYNANSKAKANNFTAVGFFISVRITDEYVQVQIVNVSTGEYVGNVTENL